MSNTSDGFEHLSVWLAGADKELRQRMFVLLILSLAKGLPVKANVQTTGGRSLWLEISMRLSTDPGSESGGPDKA